jgi:single-strand DNA-binding protein
MDFGSNVFCGRLTDDPKIIETKAGKKMCKFDVAVNRRLAKGEERTTYYPVLVVGQQAENCFEYLSKGRQVLVSATFETDTWKDKEGNNRKSYTFVVNHSGFVQFGAGGRKINEGEDNVVSAVNKATNKLNNDSGM